MANISLTRVNQKLAQARVLLDVANANDLTPIHLNSLKEAAVFHLVCAYQHYLREIAENYWLKNSKNIHNEADLIEAFDVAKKHPVEANELFELRKNVTSWLAQLHGYYEMLWQVPSTISVAVESESPQDNSVLLIDAVNLNQVVDCFSVNIALVLSWQKDFVALIQRQRETSAEF